MNKEVLKKSQKNWDFTIASLVNQGLRPGKICSKLGLPKQTVDYHIQKLKRKGIIYKIGYGVWETDKVKYTEFIKRSPKISLGPRGPDKVFTSNLHALNISIPILSGELDLVKDFEGYAQKGFNNWLPQYKRVSSPIGFTIQNNNNKSVSVYLWSRELPRTFDLTPLITGTILYVAELLSDKGVKLNVFQARTKTLHISVKNEDLDRVFNKAEKFEVLLGRSCVKVLPLDDRGEAKAWVDSSPYLGVETNDIEYKNNLVLMPERVNALINGFSGFTDKALPVLEGLRVEMKTHVKVMKGIEKGIYVFNKTVRKLDGRLSQTNLTRFI